MSSSESPSNSPSESPSNSPSISPSASESPSRSTSESYSESPSESPSPDLLGDYYVNGSKIGTGDGTDENPWNYDQLRNYFDPTITDALCNTYPIDDDIIHVKGIIDNSIDRPIFNIGRLAAGISITIQAWDIANNGIWLVETAGISGDIIFIKESAGKYFDNITFRDFGLLKSTSGTIEVLDLDGTRTTDTEILFKNSMIYATGDIVIENNDYTNFFGYGLTLYTGGDLFLIADSDTHLSIYDAVIKASNIFDALP